MFRLPSAHIGYPGYLFRLFIISLCLGALSSSILFMPLLIRDHLIVSPHTGFVLSACVSMTAFFLFTRYHLNTTRLLSIGVSSLLIYGVLVALYLLLLLALRQFSFDSHTVLTVMLPLFLLFVAFIFFPLQACIKRNVHRVLSKNLIDYQEVLCDFSSRISSSLFLPDLIEALTRDLPERLQIAGVGLMILEEKRSRLYPQNLRFGNHLWSESRLIDRLKNGHHSYFCKPVRGDEQLSDELMEIEKAGFCLVYGLHRGSQHGGMLLLGPRKDGMLYSSHDVQVLGTLANQVAIAVENALNYENLSESKKQLQQLYNKLMQAEKMAALGEMTAVLAHELKNPLGIIRSSAQFLVSGDRNPKMRQDLLQYIIDEVDELNLSINNLLGLARHKPPSFNSVDLLHKLRDFVSNWRRSEDHNQKVEIELLLPESLPTLYADFKQIGQVLLNCVANSEEVLPEGGRILISARELEDERIEIIIADSGPGVSEDVLKLVFKKFFTTKKKGLGLGLPVCRQIIRAHNGSIAMKNRAEGGCMVVIHLPLRPLINIEHHTTLP